MQNLTHLLTCFVSQVINEKACCLVCNFNQIIKNKTKKFLFGWNWFAINLFLQSMKKLNSEIFAQCIPIGANTLALKHWHSWPHTQCSLGTAELSVCFILARSEMSLSTSTDRYNKFRINTHLPIYCVFSSISI